MGYVTHANVSGLGQFATNYRWNLIFVSQPKKYTGPTLAGLNVRCESVSLPKVSTPSVEIVIRGHKVKQSGIADYGNTMSITLFETSDMYVQRVIRAWKELIWEYNTGVQQNKDDIKCDIQVVRLDNLGNPIQTYTIKGCYMEDNEAGGDLDASTADPSKPTITLSFDIFDVKNDHVALRSPIEVK